MSQLPKGPGAPKSGALTRSEEKIKNRPGFPRDDLRLAFSGDQNKGPAGNEQPDNPKHATKLRSRSSKLSKNREHRS